MCIATFKCYYDLSLWLKKSNTECFKHAAVITIFDGNFMFWEGCIVCLQLGYCVFLVDFTGVSINL
jgi:hypothetical protein